MRYTETQEWIDERADCVRIGVGKAAQSVCCGTTALWIAEVGTVLQKGDLMAIIESSKAAIERYSPLSGTVCAVNTQLHRTPALLDDDPEGAGWLLELRPSQ